MIIRSLTIFSSAPVVRCQKIDAAWLLPPWFAFQDLAPVDDRVYHQLHRHNHPWIVYNIHIGDRSKFEFLDVLGEFEFISQILALIDHVLTAKEVSQLDNVVDVVTIFDVVGFVHHSHIVEDVVLAHHKLKHNNSHGPNVWLIWLLGVMQDGL